MSHKKMQFVQCRNKKTSQLFGDLWRKYEKVRNQQDPTAHESMRISFGYPLAI